jgi:hypothetical protein
MKAVEFCYWLQGYFEIQGKAEQRGTTLVQAQVEDIQKHLALVFKHEIDPSYPDQQSLNNIHHGGIINDGMIRC